MYVNVSNDDKLILIILLIDDLSVSNWLLEARLLFSNRIYVKNQDKIGTLEETLVKRILLC